MKGTKTKSIPKQKLQWKPMWRNSPIQFVLQSVIKEIDRLRYLVLVYLVNLLVINFLFIDVTQTVIRCFLARPDFMRFGLHKRETV
jgi:hypothetical protein